MRTRSGFARGGFAPLLVLAAVVAGCAPDRIAEPRDHGPAVPTSARADIANLTNEPIVYSQHSAVRGISAITDPSGAYQADDFIVPTGETWTLTQIVITGELATPTLPFAIRTNDATAETPGTVIQSFTLAPTASELNGCTCAIIGGGVKDFLFTLDTPVTLAAGTYWLTVGPWFAARVFTFSWAQYTPIVGSQAMWGTNTNWRGTRDDRAFVLLGSRHGVAQTITFPAITPNPATVSSSATLGATTTSGLAVSYSSLTPSVCTVNANTVSYIGVGTCTVAADEPGNATYSPAAQVTQSVKVDYRYDGFLDPVKNNGVLNGAKVGQVIPLKWRLTDANGTPITTLTTVSVTVAELSCALGSTANQVGEQAAGGSGLQNLGNGYYQYNWKSPGWYANSCKTLQLDLGEGSGVRTATFAFTR